MTMADRNQLGRFWLKKFREWTKTWINMSHPTDAETRKIRDRQEVPLLIQQTVLPLYPRFGRCDFEAKEGEMEHCWHMIHCCRMSELCSLTNIYRLRRALSPEQTAVKLLSNE
jgi:hypothetical protein